MLILSQTDAINGYHGTVGTPTKMYDSLANPLFVGDLVTVHHKDYPDKTVEFVCEENPKYANYTNTEHQYVMGIANTWNSEKFKDIVIEEDEFYEQLDKISEGWIVRKVKDYKRLVVGENWGFLYIREVEETK